MIFYYVLLFHWTFAFYERHRNPGVTSGSNNIDPGVTNGTSSTRRKRIVFGEKLLLEEDQKLYPLARYQAAIISAHWCGEEALNILKKYSGEKLPEKWYNERSIGLITEHCPFEKSRAYCTGAVITEWVIQTACHCIARFTHTSDSDHQTHPYNAWEDVTYSILGAPEFAGNFVPYMSKLYLVHEKCLQIKNVTITHNIGIIVLRFRLEYQTVIAQPTTIDQMAKQWYYVIEKEVVCQVVGWGSSEFKGRDIFGPPSSHLTLTWRVVRSFVYCYDGHRAMEDFVSYIAFHKLSYKDVQSWSCTTSFGKIQSVIAPMDAGGPVACVQGWYFAVMNWGIHAYDANDSVFSHTVQTDIIYSLYENSWEYRPAFLRYIHDKLRQITFPTLKPRLLLTCPRRSKKIAPSRSTDLDHSYLFALLLFFRCLY